TTTPAAAATRLFVECRLYAEGQEVRNMRRIDIARRLKNTVDRQAVTINLHRPARRLFGG
ncbi:hypothetical protein, partial [Rhizobium sp. 18055]|uniref:hypothetical protein n=1 Tax=Rhizobium sp. 18055 TaxID=2681403 RepID=UPI001AEDE621